MDERKITLTDGSKVTPDHEAIDPTTGLQKGYVVLAAEERAKGFVRPVRRSYRHVGKRPTYPLRDLTPDERTQFPEEELVKYEAYPPELHPALGRFWTQRQLETGCDTVTTMHQALAETYARDPSFYGATYCAHCRAHFPVGEHGEFVWDDGSGQRVGT